MCLAQHFPHKYDIGDAIEPLSQRTPANKHHSPRPVEVQPRAGLRLWTGGTHRLQDTRILGFGTLVKMHAELSRLARARARAGEVGPGLAVRERGQPGSKMQLETQALSGSHRRPAAEVKAKALWCHVDADIYSFAHPVRVERLP